MNPNASPDEHQRHMQTGRAKLVKRNKKQARSSEGARQVRDCIVSGFEPDRKVRRVLDNEPLSTLTMLCYISSRSI